MHQSILAYQHFKFLKLSAALALAALLAYIWHTPSGPSNGGTWLGYGLGGLGALMIVWLMWLGVRKRYYHSRFGTLQGWVSAHVYLGLTMVLIVTLHTGFQFGFNVHTLAYILMMLVVLSGCYGMVVYLRYPSKIAGNQAGLNANIMLREVGDLNQECLSLLEGLGDNVHQAVIQSIENTVIGGTVWQQLTMAKPLIRGKVSQHRRRELMNTQSDAPLYDDTMFIIADEMHNNDNDEYAEAMRRLLELLGRRNALVRRLQRNIQYQALMDIWLYFHVPLSFAMAAALIIHIITVFLYW